MTTPQDVNSVNSVVSAGKFIQAIEASIQYQMGFPGGVPIGVDGFGKFVQCQVRVPETFHSRVQLVFINSKWDKVMFFIDSVRLYSNALQGAE